MAAKYSEAQKRATMKWNKAHTKMFNMRLHLEKDKDILDWLASLQNKEGTVKALMREEARKEKENGKDQTM